MEGRKEGRKGREERKKGSRHKCEIAARARLVEHTFVISGSSTFRFVSRHVISDLYAKKIPADFLMTRKVCITISQSWHFDRVTPGSAP